MATFKLEIACELLNDALELYYSKESYFSAIQLAGAAEELLGRHLQLIGEKSAFKSEITDFVDLLNAVAPTSGTWHKKEMVNFVNNAKNHTKHMDPGSETAVAFDPCLEAREILERAVSDYYHLIAFSTLVETPLIRRFNQDRGVQA